MANQTHQLQLDAGTYWICTCGASSNSPYCDGSHKGTLFQPTELELAVPATIEISGSVRAQTPPSSA